MATVNHAVPPAPTFCQKSRGFTLTEMAVVLVIVALLIGGMLLPMSAQDDLRRTNETRATLANVQEALLGFAVVNGRLPRPATSSADGAENPANCADDVACTGFIPWATLGIARSDAWGKLIRYSVTPAYANSNITLATIANRTVQTRDNAGNALFLAGQAACTTPGACVAVVIFSHGKQRWGTRVCSQSSQPDESTSQMNERQERLGELVVAGGDASELFDATEETLDQ
ncbi:MAG: prepilin-type N-terminal cleavage/methylation domain-containing protein, partial [Rhodocyclaceae bacterium]|nr:prepilin-type N-terminal cleavage/methylation domain-containing protein [Rhodocyclaceae bacterium]